MSTEVVGSATSKFEGDGGFRGGGGSFYKKVANLQSQCQLIF